MAVGTCWLKDATLDATEDWEGDVLLADALCEPGC